MNFSQGEQGGQGTLNTQHKQKLTNREIHFILEERSNIMGSAEAKEIMEITGREIENYMKMKLYTELTLIKEK